MVLCRKCTPEREIDRIVTLETDEQVTDPIADVHALQHSDRVSEVLPHVTRFELEWSGKPLQKNLLAERRERQRPAPTQVTKNGPAP